MDVKAIIESLKTLKTYKVAVKRNTISRMLTDLQTQAQHGATVANADFRYAPYRQAFRILGTTCRSIIAEMAAQTMEQSNYMQLLTNAITRFEDAAEAVGAAPRSEMSGEVADDVVRGRIEDIRKSFTLPTSVKKAYTLLKAPVVPVLANSEFSFDKEFAAVGMKTVRVAQYNIIQDQLIIAFDRKFALEHSEERLPRVKVPASLLEKLDENFGYLEGWKAALLSRVKLSPLDSLRTTLKVASTVKKFTPQQVEVLAKVKATIDAGQKKLDAFDATDLFVTYANEVLDSIQRSSGRRLAFVVEQPVTHKSNPNIIYFWAASSQAVTRILSRKGMRPQMWRFP